MKKSSATKTEAVEKSQYRKLSELLKYLVDISPLQLRRSRIFSPSPKPKPKPSAAIEKS